MGADVRSPNGSYRCEVFENEVESNPTCLQLYRVMLKTADNTANFHHEAKGRTVGTARATRAITIRSDNDKGLGGELVKYQPKQPGRHIT